MMNLAEMQSKVQELFEDQPVVLIVTSGASVGAGQRTRRTRKVAVAGAKRTPRADADEKPTERPAKTRKQSRTTERASVSAEGRGRGRIAGVYVPAGKEPKVQTASILKVRDFIAKHKRGTTARAIADALKMPLGTVGWALQHLTNDKAVHYQPAA